MATVQRERTNVGRRAVRWAWVAVTAMVVFLLSRWALIELFANANRSQFSLRPEVENWALPYEGTALPATLWAIGATALALLVVVVGDAVRRRPRSGRSRSHEQ